MYENTSRTQERIQWSAEQRVWRHHVNVHWRRTYPQCRLESQSIRRTVRWRWYVVVLYAWTEMQDVSDISRAFFYVVADESDYEPNGFAGLNRMTLDDARTLMLTCPEINALAQRCKHVLKRLHWTDATIEKLFWKAKHAAALLRTALLQCYVLSNMEDLGTYKIFFAHHNF